jgi:hypothetical protein
MMMKHIALVLLMAALTACEKQQTTALPAQSSMVPASPAEAKPAVASIGPVTSREPLLNAAPLGIEVGYANLAGVKEKLGGAAKLQDQGLGLYSGGPKYISDGAGLGVDGLSALALVFDNNNGSSRNRVGDFRSF